MPRGWSIRLELPGAEPVESERKTLPRRTFAEKGAVPARTDQSQQMITGQRWPIDDPPVAAGNKRVCGDGLEFPSFFSAPLFPAESYLGGERKGGGRGLWALEPSRAGR